MTHSDSKPVATPHIVIPDTNSLERPVVSGENTPAFGSDIIAETLRDLDIEYIALNPGASYRGLHDSLVNYLGNRTPQMLLCLHEEAAVAIAHGYAKVKDRAMAVAVHSNVGLFHATMPIFDAFCNRSPILILGATGPVDAAKRRPWIDWIHTTADQGAIVRNFSKWDDQPASPEAAREAIIRAVWMANTRPQAPVYVNFDAEMQEMKLPAALPPIEVSRFGTDIITGIDSNVLKQLVTLIKDSKRPLIFFGRGSRNIATWNDRVALAEMLDASVATRIGEAAVFPTDHPLHLGNPTTISPNVDVIAAMKEADLILSFGWVDLGGIFKSIGGTPKGKVVHMSLDHTLHRGWVMDYHVHPPVDHYIAADPDVVINTLTVALTEAKYSRPRTARPPKPALDKLPHDKLYVTHIADTLRVATAGREVCLTYLPISWDAARWPFRHPLDFMGGNGGGGVGAGPGITVGVALALKGSSRLPIGIIGDGDYLMGVTALWTAVHYRIPMLLIAANNRSFYNDELHQERVARMRNRPVENKWIGQRIDDPDIDLAAMGAAQGALGFGPVTTIQQLEAVLPQAIQAVDDGQTVIVDVRIEPGYLENDLAAMLQKRK